ncbi:MAG: substrate-binding domain-containing protein, partial [Asticcacaulis sp.]
IAERLKNSGNIVILRGEEGHPAAIERTQGVKEILATRAGIHLVAEAGCDWKRDKAEKQVTQWRQSGQHIDAILANNDEMALGAIDALKKANIPAGKIAVAGVDGTADALAAIRSGYLTMSFLQNANAQGKQALTDAKAFAGKQYAELYDWVPYELIIPSNVAEYAGQ